MFSCIEFLRGYCLTTTDIQTDWTHMDIMQTSMMKANIFKTILDTINFSST